MLIAGDLGGTKTRLGLFSKTGGAEKPLAQATFKSTRYSRFEDILKEFTASVDDKIEKAVFGIAGPVIGETVHLTNLSWVIEKQRLQEGFNISSVYLLNDLEALGYALPLLGPQDTVSLNDPAPDPLGNIAVIAPGTGLGEGFLVKTRFGYKPCSSEGGHTDFAPRNAMEMELLQYLLKRYAHVDYEKVCSGLGVQNLYAFLKEKKQIEEPPWLAEKISKASDSTPLIFGNALDEKSRCELCKTAVDMFINILAAEAGNLALKIFATGGVCLAGGIPPRILPLLRKGTFMEVFHRKGKMSALLKRMPVRIIQNSDAVLMGAAVYGLNDIL